jgi:ectoine hydroxylase-related dioxygenase (phytanoyl-CoA dioxygenase family)
VSREGWSAATPTTATPSAATSTAATSTAANGGPPGVDRDPTADEIAQLRVDGYLIVRDYFALEQAADINRWTVDLANAPEEHGRHWVYHETSLIEPGERVVQRIENFCPFHAEFDRLVRGGALARWVSVLMGGQVHLFKDKINFKMPGGDGFKVHQDQQAGWTKYAPLFVTAMVSIDAATLENGCLEVAPRRAGEGLIGDEWKPLTETGLELRPVPTAPGDVIFFDSFVPHASKPNLTAAPRRVLYLTYNLADHGDQRARYYADKHAAFPPDIDREAGKTYVFRV